MFYHIYVILYELGCCATLRHRRASQPLAPQICAPSLKINSIPYRVFACDIVFIKTSDPIVAPIDCPQFIHDINVQLAHEISQQQHAAQAPIHVCTTFYSFTLAVVCQSHYRYSTVPYRYRI